MDILRLFNFGGIIHDFGVEVKDILVGPKERD